MTDQALINDIKAKYAALADAIDAATDAGLVVRVEIDAMDASVKWDGVRGSGRDVLRVKRHKVEGTRSFT